MSLLANSNAIETGGYQISRSVRLRSSASAYFNKTFSTTPTNRAKKTVSCWCKRSTLSSAQDLFSSYNGSGQDGLFLNSSDSLQIYAMNGGAGGTVNGVLRDVSAWYHIVYVIDTTQATAGDRLKIWINGVNFPSGSWTSYSAPSLNSTADILFFQSTEIGRDDFSSSGYLNGYLTETYFIDGQALTPSDFGETDSNTGVWKPKAYTGTYGTNGFYLKFADNSGTTSTTLGKDSSGNGNNWTPNNFSVTAGAGNDSLVDTPTNYGTDSGLGAEVRGNYCTWNSTWANPTLTNGNLDYTTTAGSTSAIGTLGVSSGKWYFEVLTTTSACSIGVAPPELFNKEIGETSTSYGYTYNGTKYTNGSTSAYGNSYTANDIIGVALDLDNGKIWFSKNGTFQASGDPAAGTNAAFTGLSGTFTVGVSRMTPTQQSGSLNAGQRAFAYTAPSGFKALCTQNLPTPTIGATSTTQANKYFTPYLYTADGTSPKSRTGIGFAPDFLWFKSRSTTFSHALYDQVRGTNKGLQTNTTAAENTYTLLSTFGSDGFTTTTDGTVGNILNDGTNTYVTWAWKANGAGVTNTAGTITSTVSANTTSGFSIVSFNAGAAGNKTVGHGLSSVPSLIIMKDRQSTGYGNWSVFHSSVCTTTSNYLLLNGTGALGSVSNTWGSALPTSSVFGFGSNVNIAANDDIIAYCFAPVAGYSAFGSYTGNGSADGPFVYTGFAPRYVLVKSSTEAGQGWIIADRARSTYNVSNQRLRAETSDSEGTDNGIDFLSNGFKVRTTNWNNTSGQTQIYAAFAENPFKYSLAR
ncbi:MAG TPA: SPRY domain-containing protein [Rheinheimera sp.]|nr:SPRY domain-containing protein [Rheinheimera sp.]